MKQSKNLPVIFRVEKFKGEWTPLAVFPSEEGTNDFRFSVCLCYGHLGQHSVVSHDYYISKTKPATKEQYEPLLKELTDAVGYENLRIVKKWLHHYAG